MAEQKLVEVNIELLDGKEMIVQVNLTEEQVKTIISDYLYGKGIIGEQGSLKPVIYREHDDAYFAGFTFRTSLNFGVPKKK